MHAERKPAHTRRSLEVALADAAIGAVQTAAAPCGIVTLDLRAYIAHEPLESVCAPEIAAKLAVVPLYRNGGAVVVAMEHPEDADLVQRARFAIGARIVPVQAAREDVGYGLAVLQGRILPDIGAVSYREADALASRLISEASADIEAPHPGCDEGDAETTVVQLVNRIIIEAHREGASDIHIEPRHEVFCIRLRRDGELTDYLTVPKQSGRTLVSRIKVLACLDISERRKAQDGKIKFGRPGEPQIELRVVTIPLAHGQEAVALRLLSASRAVSMEELDLSPAVLRSLRGAAEQPYGLILVCGPTGSGKTTTLHSVLGYLNDGKRKIWTAEDPIEITQHGLSQVQVNQRIGWTFAAALRAFLRADPDVIMVGEMRDRETAAIAMEAGLTGHLVMSTLHTNGAPEAATRLVEMGLDPLSCSDALIGVLGQRLARRVCQSCVQLRAASTDEKANYAAEYDEGHGRLDTGFADLRAARMATPVGCGKCNYSGYRGRIGLYEWMPLSPILRKLLQRRASAEELRLAAIAQGMKTLRQDGVEKALRGLTTLEQVRSVCGIKAERAPSPPDSADRMRLALVKS